MISTLLFERPFVLAGMCVTGEVVWLALWVRGRSRAAGRAAWLWPLASAALVTLSVSVQTPREQVIQTCRALARAVDAGDIDAIGEGVAEGFSADGLTRREFLNGVAAALTRVRVDTVRLRTVEVALDGRTRARAAFAATCNVRSADGFAGALPSRWKVSLRREDDRWLVTGLESVPVPPLQMRRLRDWLE